MVGRGEQLTSGAYRDPGPSAEGLSFTPTIPWRGCYCYPGFTNEESEAQNDMKWLAGRYTTGK